MEGEMDRNKERKSSKWSESKREKKDVEFIKQQEKNEAFCQSYFFFWV